ncbi:hypothetical protein BAY59_10830 [Prauserella coralliicola]|nr:hypothetical protein BAY59_10830 [Prauserella coralliicola]
MAKNECAARCGRRAQATLCGPCRDELVVALRGLAYTVNKDGRRGPGLCETLDDALAKRLKRGDGQIGFRGRGYTWRLPYDSQASAVADRVGRQIDFWVTAFAQAYPRLQPSFRSVAGACAWLAEHPTELAAFWDAGKMYRDIRSIVSTVERAVNRDDLRYVGVCSAALDGGGECDEDLYARADRAKVTCRQCGTQHDVAYRRQKLSEAIEDQLATAAECSRIAPNLIGRELSSSTIRNWASEGKLDPKPPHPLDERKLPRYRIGDVVKLAREAPTRRRGRKVANRPRAA